MCTHILNILDKDFNLYFPIAAVIKSLFSNSLSLTLCFVLH